MVDMSTTLGARRLANPLMTASGCAANGQELHRFFDVSELGAFVTKSVMSEPRSGRGTPRMAETPDARMFDVVTVSAGARPEEFVEAAKAASSVDTLTAFLDDVRKRFGSTAAAPSAESPRS